ncbi:Aminotransferase-like mobile domain containing protein [Trema orientale]|uniref:Aminotransferase-like mobile domain containing protein n=1 Tax=Trema orientale TaxID=63057 RepID=A0A2P5AJC9_TREOI|nr:Aminotransferase-like mobile domain containing protein [Trema orientale]
MHYVIGWLAEHFRDLYSGWDSSIDLPLLSKYAGVPAEDCGLNGTRRILREEDYVIHRPYSFPAEEDLDFLDNEDLSDERFESLISMCSCMLPVRVGKELYVEPYYPNRFARQFGFDHRIPSNKLCSNFLRRTQCGITLLKPGSYSCKEIQTFVFIYQGLIVWANAHGGVVVGG